ncbi:MAG: OsmC family protein [Thermoplasmata archaeon]
MESPAPAPEVQTELSQIEKYEFSIRYPGHRYGSWVVDEPPPVGGDQGPNPVQALAAAVGHCMSSTLYNILERAHVASHPIRTTVRAEVGPNAKGRRRVLRIDLSIETSPVDEKDRERFDHCVAIFEDFCTVSGAVREGIKIKSDVHPPSPP